MEVMMNSTTTALGACSGTHPLFATALPEIRIQRELIEAELDSFREQVSQIRRRQRSTFESLRDLLPQMVSAMAERELSCRIRSATLTILLELYSEGRRLSLRLRRMGRLSTYKKRTIADATLVEWLVEGLPEIMGRSMDLLGDYFDELLQCSRELELGRSRLFCAFDIPVCEQPRDLGWIREVKIAASGPPFAWTVPLWWHFAPAFRWLRAVLLPSIEKSISTSITEYCDRLSDMAADAASDWLSDIQWQIDEQCLQRTDVAAISAEIVKLLRERWRGRLPERIYRQSNYSSVEPTAMAGD
ncbi:MAG TPA: hypothetical protein VMF91_20560 [Bryobacteraceae bacterium]|nr:hypothetical protein [Bryobacteraceae bacterium]